MATEQYISDLERHASVAGVFGICITWSSVLDKNIDATYMRGYLSGFYAALGGIETYDEIGCLKDMLDTLEDLP